MDESRYDPRPTNQERAERASRSGTNQAVATWIQLLRTAKQTERALMDNMRGLGLTPGCFEVLAHTAVAEGLTQQELADRLLVTKGNVSQLLDKLERAGLVVRRAEGTRARHIYLTDAGRQRYDSFWPEHTALIAERFAVLSPAEQTELRRLLRRVEQSPAKTLPPTDEG